MFQTASQILTTNIKLMPLHKLQPAEEEEEDGEEEEEDGE